MARHTSTGRSYSGRHSNKPTARRTSHRAAKAGEATRTATARVQMNRAATIHAALALATAGPSVATMAFAVATPTSVPASTPTSAPRRATSHRATSHAARSSAPLSLSARAAKAARTANAGPPKRGKGRRSVSSSKRRGLHLERLLRISKGRLLVGISALLTVASLAVGGSWAAWTATDTNAQTLNSNTVTLSDNQGGSGGATVSAGTAMINTSAVEPGYTATVCMGVNFTGTAAISTLTLGGSVSGSTGVLAPKLKMTSATYRTNGTAVSGTTNAASCTGYNAGSGGTTVGSANASLDTWCSAACTISSPVTSTSYKFIIDDNGIGSCATYCGLSLTFTLTWTLTTT